MDLNLFLLKRKEEYLLQEICRKTSKIFGQDFYYEDTRTNVDVIIISTDASAIRNTLSNDISNIEIDRIIEDCQREYNEFESELQDEENNIRRAIDDERRRRRDNENGEEWPRLPNYEDIDGNEPRNIDWDDLPYDDANELENANDRELDAIIDGLLNYRTYRRQNYVNENYVQYYLTTKCENLFDDCISNYYLMLLDDRIKQLREYRVRLNSGNLLGYFTRYFDADGKETKRNIRLFLDNIGNEARYMSVDRIEVLANVYIHELFHAYYSENMIKRHAWVNCINEIEEAMTEFGMLGFMQQNYPQYLSSAKKSVRNKLNHQDLWHYGLGSNLFDVFNSSPSVSSFFNDRIFTIYQVVQMSLRNDKNRVKQIKSLFAANTLDSNRIIALIFKMFTIYYPIRNDGRSHHYFNGNTFGFNNHMANSVFEYYIQRNRPTTADVLRDFPKTCGLHNTYPALLDKNNANPNRYNFNIQFTLADGKTVVPRRMWTSTYDGDAFVLIQEVDSLYRRGILDRHVLYLG